VAKAPGGLSSTLRRPPSDERKEDGQRAACQRQNELSAATEPTQLHVAVPEGKFASRLQRVSSWAKHDAAEESGIGHYVLSRHFAWPPGPNAFRQAALVSLRIRLVPNPGMQGDLRGVAILCVSVTY
jgi:hypothetical protein